MPSLKRRLIMLFTALRAATAAAYIEFRNTVGVGGGGIARISKTGITSVNDAGAAGFPFGSYNPTIDYVYIGNAATTSMLIAAFGQNFYIAGGLIQENRADLVHSLVNNLDAGWLLAKGVHSCRERGDAPPITEIPGAGGSIAWINGRGGLKRLTAVVAGGETYEHNNSCDWISLQDVPRLYSRWTMQQWNAGVPDAFGAVGWRDWGNNNCVWFQWDAAVVGGNITIRANRAGATTIHDTGIAAVIGQFHICELISTATGLVTCYIGGALVHTLAAAEVPVVTTLMEEWKHSAVIAPSILSQLDYDISYTVLSRNTGVAP